jgi:hypothetical protein
MSPDAPAIALSEVEGITAEPGESLALDEVTEPTILHDD